MGIIEGGRGLLCYNVCMISSKCIFCLNVQHSSSIQSGSPHTYVQQQPPPISGQGPSLFLVGNFSSLRGCVVDVVFPCVCHVPAIESIKQCRWDGIDVLGMTPPRSQLPLGIGKRHGRKRQGLADYASVSATFKPTWSELEGSLFSQTALPRIVSPILPPLLRYVTGWCKRC